jgi:hypothetical protein
MNSRNITDITNEAAALRAAGIKTKLFLLKQATFIKPPVLESLKIQFDLLETELKNYVFFINNQGQLASLKYHALNETVTAMKDNWYKHRDTVHRENYHDSLSLLLLVNDIDLLIDPLRIQLNKDFK